MANRSALNIAMADRHRSNDSFYLDKYQAAILKTWDTAKAVLGEWHLFGVVQGSQSSGYEVCVHYPSQPYAHAPTCEQVLCPLGPTVALHHKAWHPD